MHGCVDAWMRGWRTREGAQLCLILSLNQKGEGVMVQCDEFLGTPTLPSAGEGGGCSVLVSPFALLCWPAPLFIQPPFDLFNCC